MAVQQKIFLFILAIIAIANSGCTTTSSAALAPNAGFLFDLPAAAILAFDKPGQFGNWWRKEPLDAEKEFFAKALAGPASPKDNLKTGDFVGWHGVLLGCEKLGSSTAKLTLDHRFASELNLQFGPRDSESIYTISLFGEGLFTAVVEKPCSTVALPGDLLRVYGIADVTKNGVVVKTSFNRFWPRSTYELTPRVAKRNQDGSIVREKSGWVDLAFDQTVIDRKTAADSMLLKLLRERTQDSNVDIRSRVAFTMGELPAVATRDLESARLTEKDTAVIKTLDFAIKRSKSEIGPYWNTSKPEPYWKN